MSTTQRYAHLQPDAVKSAAQKSAELLTPGARKRNVITLTERK